MATKVSLSEFVEAFSHLGEGVSADTWIWQDLALDANELDWEMISISKQKGWTFHWETNLTRYLPLYSYWGLSTAGYADLKVRELYAFGRPTDAND